MVLMATNLFGEEIFVYPEKYEHTGYDTCKVPVQEARSECDPTRSIKAEFLYDLNNDGICELFVPDEPCFGNGGPFYHLFEWRNGKLKLIGAVNPAFWLAKKYNGYAQILYPSYFGHRTNPGNTVAVQRYDGKRYQFLPVPEISYCGYGDLGMKYYKNHDYLKAEIYYLNLYRMKREEDIHSANDLAVTWIKLQKYGQAEILLKKHIEASADAKGSAAAYFNLGLIYETTNKREDALSAFTASNALSPTAARQKKVDELRRRVDAAPWKTRTNNSNRRFIGESLGDSFIYTNRTAWEKDYPKRALDNIIYRLGDDIVLFVGSKSSGKPDLLEMTPAKNFSQEELKRFTPASRRKDIPPRDHDLFNTLDERGFQHQE